MTVPEGNNILSVMIVDDQTGKWSDIYRGRFVYYPVSEETSVDVTVEESAAADSDKNKE
jgi:hypothetical protein